MADLFIQINELPRNIEDAGEVTANWLALDSKREMVARGTSDVTNLLVEVQEATDLTDFVQIVMFIPDDVAFFSRVTVPARTVSQARRALPFVVESFVVDDIETLHIAAGEIRRNRPIETLSIDKDRMAGLIELCTEGAIVPTQISTLGCHMRVADDTVAIASDGHRILIRASDQLATVEAQDLDETLTQLFTESDEDSEIEFEVYVSEETDASEFEWNVSGEVKQRSIEGDLLSAIATSYTPSDGVNLAQGTFAFDGDKRSVARRWATTGALATAGILLYAGIMFTEGMWAKVKSESLRAESVATYESIFGSSPGPRHPVHRMKARIGEGHEPTSNIALLVSPIAEEVVAAGEAIQLNSLQYTDSPAVMQLELEVPNFERLETLEQSLQSQNITVEIQSAETRANRVRANLTMRASP